MPLVSGKDSTESRVPSPALSEIRHSLQEAGSVKKRMEHRSPRARRGWLASGVSCHAERPAVLAK